MNVNDPNENALSRVEEERREFIKKLIAGTAFAAPLLAFFSMDGGLIKKAEACGSLCINQTKLHGPHTFRASYGDNTTDTIWATASASIALNCTTLVVTFNTPMAGSQADISAFLVDKENALNLALETGSNVFTEGSPIWNAMRAGNVFLGLRIFGSGYSDFQEAQFTPAA